MASVGLHDFMLVVQDNCQLSRGTRLESAAVAVNNLESATATATAATVLAQAVILDRNMITPAKPQMLHEWPVNRCCTCGLTSVLVFVLLTSVTS